MKKIKVYYIGCKIKEIRSGGDKYLTEMLQGLEQSCDLEFWDISECKFVKEEVRFKITWKAISYAIKTNLWAINKLKKVNKNDVILINSYYKQQFFLVPWIAKYLKRCRIILSVNALYDYSRSNILLRVIDRIIMRLFLLPADRVIANSKPTKERISKMGASRKKTKLVYPRLDLPPDLPGSSPRNDGLFHILYVGYCTPYKEVDILIKAIRILKSIPIQLHIVGEIGRNPLYFNKLKNLIIKFGLEEKVTFYGRLEGIELSAQYKNADIFANASRGEGYGRVFIEAMHFGLPIIGANLGGAKELIIDGVNGFLFQPGNAEDLANKISNLYSDKNLRQKMGENALQMSKKANFTKDIGEQTFGVISEIARQSVA